MANISELTAFVTDPTLNTYGQEALMLYSGQRADGICVLKLQDESEPHLNDGSWVRYGILPQFVAYEDAQEQKIENTALGLPDAKDLLIVEFERAQSALNQCDPEALEARVATWNILNFVAANGDIEGLDTTRLSAPR